MFLFDADSQPKSIFQGLFVLSRGFKFSIQNKGLLALSLAPIFIALVSLYFFYTPLYGSVFGFMNEYFLKANTFDFFGGWILLKLAVFLLKILTAISVFLVFYILLQFIYIPFCSFLAEWVLVNKGIKKFDGLGSMLKFNLSMAKTGLLKSLVLIALGLIFFVTSFFPVLSFLPLYFALIVLSYDSFDYGLELYGLKLSERSLFCRKEFGLINGHAGMLFLLSFVPGFLLLTLPFSVIGASLILGDLYDAKRKST